MPNTQSNNEAEQDACAQDGSFGLVSGACSINCRDTRMHSVLHKNTHSFGHKSAQQGKHTLEENLRNTKIDEIKHIRPASGSELARRLAAWN